MSRFLRRAFRMAIGSCGVLAGIPGAARAQTLSGHVVDGESNAAIPAASVFVVSASGDTLRVSSGAEGAFRLELEGTGTYSVSAESLGYRRSAPTPIRFDSWAEQVDVVVRLSARALELGGITVTARGFATRHRASLDGFKVRLETALPVGPVRLVGKNDPEMRSSFDVGDVLRFFHQRAGRCYQLFIDGRLRRDYGDIELIPLEDLEGIEFYRDPRDAPLEMRTGERCSVLALWRTPLGGGQGRPERLR